MTLLQAVILAIIEGLTEFLPVSSTGHMILASWAMQIHDSEFVKTFEIVIQLGAILAVVALYYRRFFVSIDIYLKLLAAFLPTGILGFLFYKFIKSYLFNPWTVSTALVAGGVVLIILDRWAERRKTRYSSVEALSYGGAFLIGLIQSLSMVPGVSRAAATIIGGVLAGFDRKQATEFSFLLAIPTMLAASGYDLLKSYAYIQREDLFLLLTGSAVAFAVALAAVKGFIYPGTALRFQAFWLLPYRSGIGFLSFQPSVGEGADPLNSSLLMESKIWCMASTCLIRECRISL
ncbi:MAG: undecaprenyl-diphosphatase [Chitinophagales bacterium]|nr:MAG: undecaprenyl-diphosphatase [Chitinophagales bacterium]